MALTPWRTTSRGSTSHLWTAHTDHLNKFTPEKEKPRTTSGTRAIPRFHLILLLSRKSSLGKFKSKLCAITGSHRNFLLFSETQLADVIHGQFAVPLHQPATFW